ncbi:MAG: hypothetical protein R3B49_03910 [Phycisphaerales bacterium]
MPDAAATLDVVEPAWTDDALARAGGSDAGLLACAAHVANDHARRGDALVRGPSTGVRAATSLGIRTIDRRPTARRCPLLTRSSNPVPGRGAPYARLWGTPDRTAARPGARLELHTFAPPDDRAARVGRAVDRVVVRTEQDRLAWTQVGVAAALHDAPDFRELAGRLRDRREMLRERVGLADRVLIMVLADHPRMIDARQFGFLLGFLGVAGHRIGGVLPRAARHAPLAWRHLRGLLGPCRLFETDLPVPALLPACDLALLPASEEGTGADAVLRAWADALGVTTVRWGQREPGKLRHTPASAGPVVRALEAMHA